MDRGLRAEIFKKAILELCGENKNDYRTIKVKVKDKSYAVMVNTNDQEVFTANI